MKIQAMLGHEKVFAELEQAGVITDASQLSRVVIDVRRGLMTVVYVEMLADKSMLDIVRLLRDVELVENPSPAPDAPPATTGGVTELRPRDG